MNGIDAVKRVTDITARSRQPHEQSRGIKFCTSGDF